MIDLDKVYDAKSILKRWCDDGMESVSTPIRYEQLLGLMNKIAAAEKDAARYRWLRNCDTKQTELLVENGHIVGFGVLDAMIDEAMQCK